MPFLKVCTNAELKISKEEFVEKAAEMIAVELGKPIGYVVVLLNKKIFCYPLFILSLYIY